MNLDILYLSVVIYHFLYLTSVSCDINLVKINKIPYILFKISSIA